MVLKGQFLERPALIPTEGGLVLEGTSHRGNLTPPLLVLPPAPAEGGGMDHVVAAELVFAAARNGHPTLRFNYRGVGGSQGARARSPEALLADARAAYELASDNARGAACVIAALGASDIVALKLAIAVGAAGVLLVNPTLASPSDAATLRVPVSVVLPEHDSVAVPRLDWAEWLAARGDRLTVVPGADRSYQRHLVMVGQAAAQFLAQTDPSR